MTQNQMKRRPRPRTNGRKSGHGSSRGGHDGHDGNRMDPKSRNNARQMLDKYKSMARDALQSNDRVQSEYYFQHAEHYQRVLNDIEEANKARDEQRAKVQSENRNKNASADVKADSVAGDRDEAPSVDKPADDVVAEKPRPRGRARKPAPVSTDGAETPIVADTAAEVVVEASDGEVAATKPRPRPRTRKPAAKPVKDKPAASTAEDAA